jgi:hypothetical protein
MSALGQKQTCALQKAMSALRSIATAKADMPQMVMSALPPKAGAAHYPMSAMDQKRIFGKISIRTDFKLYAD